MNITLTIQTPDVRRQRVSRVDASTGRDAEAGGHGGHLLVGLLLGAGISLGGGGLRRDGEAASAGRGLLRHAGQ